MTHKLAFIPSAACLLFAATTTIAAPGQDHRYDFGQPGNPQAVDRTIEMRMGDNFFEQEKIEVKAGETIRFVLHNDGALLHEFNIGKAKDHAQHQVEMAEMLRNGMLTPTGIHDMSKMEHAMNDSGPGMGRHMNHGMETAMQHNDPNSVLLEPGAREELIWTFSKTTGLEFACNVPGHYQAGMFGKVEIR